MLSVNRATILGHLTRDPELRYTPNGQAVANFGIATNRRWKTPTGEMQEQSEFHDVVAWGKLAETTNQMLKKGSPAYVEGRLQTRSWEAPDGTKRYKTEIVAQLISALGTKGMTTPGETTDEAAAGQTADIAASLTDQAATSSDEGTKKSKGSKTEETKPTPNADEISLDDIPF